jgi:hypothetical protein
MEFIKRYKSLKFTQEEIDNLNSTVCMKEVEIIVKSLLLRKLQFQRISFVNFTKYLMKNNINSIATFPKL